MNDNYLGGLVQEAGREPFNRAGRMTKTRILNKVVNSIA
jgi:hypothetical protein